jgi:microcystin-dependent protein
MDKINFTAKDNFPLSSDTMDLMQRMIQLNANIAAIGGTDYILTGCDDDGQGNISAGVVVIAGEILPFEAGAKKDKVTVAQTTKTLTAFGVDYPEAYIYRTAKFADAGSINWSDIARLMTNQQLQAKIEAITGDAPGTVKMWAGSTSKIPSDYMLCDGRELQIASYQTLYDSIGIAFGGDGLATFKLPDLRGRFVVGYDSADPDYNTISADKAGGQKEVQLTVDQLARHRHIYTDDTNAVGSFAEIEPGFPLTASTKTGQTSASGSSGLGTAYYATYTGNGQAHENRPPYIVLAYIIKIK